MEQPRGRCCSPRMSELTQPTGARDHPSLPRLGLVVPGLNLIPEKTETLNQQGAKEHDRGIRRYQWLATLSYRCNTWTWLQRGMLCQPDFYPPTFTALLHWSPDGIASMGFPLLEPSVRRCPSCGIFHSICSLETTYCAKVDSFCQSYGDRLRGPKARNVARRTTCVFRAITCPPP